MQLEFLLMLFLKKELEIVKSEYGEPRRSSITFDEGELKKESIESLCSLMGISSKLGELNWTRNQDFTKDSKAGTENSGVPIKTIFLYIAKQ